VPSDTVSVTLALGECPYQKTLASSLLAAHMLRRVLRVTPSLSLEVLDATSAGSLSVTKDSPTTGWSLGCFGPYGVVSLRPSALVRGPLS